MSSHKTTPGLPDTSPRATPRHRPLRPSKPSGPGVRWRLSPTFCVRFTRDMTRVHIDGGSRRNLVQLRYRTTMRDRPSDLVLATLLTFSAAPAVPDQGHRTWLLAQEADGWTLALEVRNGPEATFVLPGQKAPGHTLGVRIDLGNPREVANMARELWQVADQRITNPDLLPEVMLSWLTT